MRVTNGRLKRRECPGEPTEVIFYERPNKSGPRLSNFTIYTEEQAGFVTHAPMAFPDFEDLARESRSFEGMAAYTSSGLVRWNGSSTSTVAPSKRWATISPTGPGTRRISGSSCLVRRT